MKRTISLLIVILLAHYSFGQFSAAKTTATFQRLIAQADYGLTTIVDSYAVKYSSTRGSQFNYRHVPLRSRHA